MPTFRADVRELPPYIPGRPIADVAEEFGFDPNDIVKLASNEHPFPPIPAVREVMRASIETSHRYPDNDVRLLRAAVAESLGVDASQTWIGAGSSELLRVIAMAAGGPGTSAVYAWPSFIIYRMGSVLAMADRIEIPLDEHGVHDLDAMAAAIRDDTTVVYVCNPNNPTGTLVAADALAGFVEAIPERVLVVIDEAYHEYAVDPAHATAVPLAVERPNVVVTRTFSKIHGLAALRVGYAVSLAENVSELRKAQAPFTVTSMAQAAALESLAHPDEISTRAAFIADGRALLESELARLDITYIPSQANFVYFRLGATTEQTSAAFTRHGIVVRPFSGGWVRVSVGSRTENQRFITALEQTLPELR